MNKASRERALPMRRRVYGVDFSGAADAGQKIWLAAGTIQGEALRIEHCWRGEDLPGSARECQLCLPALSDFLAKQGDAVFGLDFPFGLPARLVEEETWEKFVRLFRKRYASPHNFREACRGAAEGRELRRATDGESRTPFCPYNLRLYRQTYFGIRDLLAPLVASGAACILPMQPATPGVPWILEVCPASLLKREQHYGHPYKGKAPSHRAARRHILRHFERQCGLAFGAAQIREKVLADPGGDALDSVLAALATYRTLRNPTRLFPTDTRGYALEGYVYV